MRVMGSLRDELQVLRMSFILSGSGPWHGQGLGMEEVASASMMIMYWS